MTFAEAERLLESSDAYRLLRRVPALAQWTLPGPVGETRRGVFVDTETTGLDHERDEVIELALLPFDYDRESGRITRVDEALALSGFREPSFPIPPETTRVHGISDADVAGCAIDAEHIRALVEPAHIIIAHNAAFDRPMVEKHWPIFAQKHWGCSLTEIDWKAEDISSGKLDYILMRLGWFHDGHRALSDALASLFILATPLPVSQRPALAALLECARRPLRAVRAEDTAFEQRAALKARGYRWDEGASGRKKAWWILTDSPQAEIEWLTRDIYGAPRAIPVIKMPATMRYSTRLWPQS